MRFTNEHARLGLDALDIRILNALHAHGELLSYQLAKELPDPRTTVDHRLRRLHSRKWVKKNRYGKRWKWELAPSARAFFSKPTHGALQTALYADVDALLDAVESNVSSGNKARLFFLEPSAAGVSLVAKQDKRYGELQRVIRETGRIAEGVTGEALLHSLGQEKRGAMQGRLFELYTVPDQLLDFKEIIWVVDDTVYLIDPEKQLYQSIRSVSFAHSMHTLIRALEHYGNKINMADFTRG